MQQMGQMENNQIQQTNLAAMVIVFLISVINQVKQTQIQTHSQQLVVVVVVHRFKKSKKMLI